MTVITMSYLIGDTPATVELLYDALTPPDSIPEYQRASGYWRLIGPPVVIGWGPTTGSGGTQAAQLLQAVEFVTP